MRSLSFLGDQRRIFLKLECKAPQEKSLETDCENCVEKRMNIEERQHFPFRFGTMQIQLDQRKKAQRESCALKKNLRAS